MIKEEPFADAFQNRCTSFSIDHLRWLLLFSGIRKLCYWGILHGLIYLFLKCSQKRTQSLVFPSNLDICNFAMCCSSLNSFIHILQSQFKLLITVEIFNLLFLWVSYLTLFFKLHFRESFLLEFFDLLFIDDILNFINHIIIYLQACSVYLLSYSVISIPLFATPWKFSKLYISCVTVADDLKLLNFKTYLTHVLRWIFDWIFLCSISKFLLKNIYVFRVLSF